MKVSKKKIGLTHTQCVVLAERWVRKAGNNWKSGYPVTMMELKSSTLEIPDVVGFNSDTSMVIECKTSRGDFLKDKKKPHRSNPIGSYRYYCCPEGLLTPEEMPEGWGLLYIIGKNVFEVKEATRFLEKNREAEYRLMYSALRRIKNAGKLKEVYDPKNSKTNYKKNHLDITALSH